MSSFTPVLNAYTNFSFQTMAWLVMWYGNGCKCMCIQLNDGNYTILKNNFPETERAWQKNPLFFFSDTQEYGYKN